MDGNWNLKRNFKKLQLLDSYKNSCGGSYGFIKSLSSVLKKTLPDRVIVMWDGMKAGKMRYDIYKPYKANRKKDWDKEEDIYADRLEDSDDLEKLDLLTQKMRTFNVLEMLYIRQIEVDYIEADDLIAGYVLQSEREQRDEDIIIFSRDKDYKQLISERVSIVTPDSVNMITIKNFKEKNGYVIENELLFRCFEGDKSDCISGVNGITINTLKKIFPDVVDKKYSYKELSDRCLYFINEEKKKQKVYQKIVDARHILYRNAELMNLRKPFLSEQAKVELDEISKFSLEEREIKDAIDLLTIEYIELMQKDGIDMGSFFSPFYRIMNKEMEYKKNKNNNS